MSQVVGISRIERSTLDSLLVMVVLFDSLREPLMIYCRGWQRLTAGARRLN